jgi:hypothetical protein
VAMVACGGHMSVLSYVNMPSGRAAGVMWPTSGSFVVAGLNFLWSRDRPLWVTFGRLPFRHASRRWGRVGHGVDSRQVQGGATRSP